MKIKILYVKWAAILSATLVILAIAGHYNFLTEVIAGSFFLGIIIASAIYIYKIIHSEKKLSLSNQLLRESENRFRNAFDNAAIGMALIGIDGQFMKVNNALCQILDYKENELLTLNIQTVVHPEDYNRDLKMVNQVTKGEKSILRSEQRWYDKTGQVIWMLVNLSVVSDDDLKPQYFIAQLQNITAEKKTKDELEKMAYRDPLTGLGNRHRFEDLVKQISSSAQRRVVKFAFILLDLDHFKNINDSIGHDAGDELLKIVADRLKSTVRSTDLISRFGGDEFVLVVTDIKKLEEVATIAQKILAILLQPIVIKGHSIYISTSIGISVYPEDGDTVKMLLKNADLALYRAKEKGRNNYQFCTPEMTSRAHEKLAKQTAITQALTHNEFFIHYQPKMNLATQKMSGVEALLRWNNKHFGSVTTNEIISLSEESGLIIALGDWILDMVCKQIKKWQEAGLPQFTVAINLSVKQFKKMEFAETMLKIIRDNQISPEFLEIEITENLILQDPENTLNILKLLKEAGVKISIDDFGTGYSSLSYLKSFNVDKIKIDRTFIRRIENDETSRAIISALITMANKLQIETIAEGVETRAQYEFLLNEKCTEVQGYYISKPIAADTMQQFLKDLKVRLSNRILSS